ncbi:MAG: nuclear transport factor 2 family protein [Oscillospiraceae bacterium]|nr:nuclear transport factor 2 family protein [Oscillospiraceae bacterium]
MKKIVTIIVALAVVTVTVVVGISIVNKVIDSPKNTIEKFEEAYNSLDVEGMVECFEPSVQALYSGANSLLGNYLGVDFNTIAALAPFIARFDEDFADQQPQIKIDIKDIEKTSDTTAVVYCEMSYTYASDAEECAIEMVKVDGEWYIDINALF